MSVWSGLTLFLYITARLSGFVLFNPLFGRTNIPAIVRSGFVLVLSVSVYGMTDQAAAMPSTALEFMLRLLLEMAVGFLLGMVMQIFFYIPLLAGEAIDTQMGMTMNQIYDAASQANMSVTGVVLNILMTLLFFAANGHVTLLRLFLTSGDVVPFGAAALTDDIYRAMLTVFVECTILAVKLAMPILAAELIGQVGMGVLMKVIPQINVFAINIDLKIIIGLLLLLMLIAPYGEFLLDVESNMLQTMEHILGMTAGT